MADEKEDQINQEMSRWNTALEIILITLGATRTEEPTWTRRRSICTHEIEHYDEHEVDEGSGDGRGQFRVAPNEVRIRLVYCKAHCYPVHDHAEHRRQHHEQLTQEKQVASNIGRNFSESFDI